MTTVSEIERVAVGTRRVAAALDDVSSAVAYVADAFEGFAHETFHRLDGPGSAPCGRCASLLDSTAQRDAGNG